MMRIIVDMMGGDKAPEKTPLQKVWIVNLKIAISES